MALDRGRSSVTVAEGRIYTVEDFAPMHLVNGIFEDPAASGSRLVCRSAETGEVVWQIGRRKAVPAAGREFTETERLTNAATFLAAPTWSAGRLFTVAEYVDGYYGLCLDAATGRPMWSCFLSQRPRGGAEEGPAAAMTMGSPPAVAAGVAYFLTNAGVLAALDEHSGAVEWLLRYETRPVGVDGGAAVWPATVPPLTLLPPSPLVVAGGKIVCLPADSDKVIAVNVSGVVAWSQSRATKAPPPPAAAAAAADSGADIPGPIPHLWLAGLAGDRVILSGPDATALRSPTALQSGGRPSPVRAGRRCPRQLFMCRSRAAASPG